MSFLSRAVKSVKNAVTDAAKFVAEAAVTPVNLVTGHDYDPKYKTDVGKAFGKVTGSVEDGGKWGINQISTGVRFVTGSEPPYKGSDFDTLKLGKIADKVEDINMKMLPVVASVVVSAAGANIATKSGKDFGVSIAPREEKPFELPVELLLLGLGLLLILRK